MSALQTLSLLALQHVAGYATQAVGAGSSGRDAVASLRGHLADNSTKLTEALRTASERAVAALGMALEGDSLWNRCKSTLTKGEDRALRDQVRAFLDANPLTVVNRKECLAELRAAQKAGIFAREQRLELGTLGRDVERFATFADPVAQVNAQWKLIDSLAEGMRPTYPNLSGLLAARPTEGMPLLVVAVRYYFRREVEADGELFRGLSLARAEEALSAQEAGFDALHRAMTDHGDRLRELLGDIRVVVAQTHDGVLSLQSQVGDLSEAMRSIDAAVQRLLGRDQLDKRPLRPGDSVSYRNDAERDIARKLIGEYRSLPPEERQRSPALLNAVGKLGMVAGNLVAAQQDFQDVAGMAKDNPTKAEAHYNAYMVALEHRDLEAALRQFIEAVKLDAKRFAPFPVGKYHPTRILGAGGFGVVFLCKHKLMNAPIVVKAIRPEGLTLDPDKVFSEAQLLRELDHPAVIRMSDCGYIDTPGQDRRPYLVMDYFEGGTLQEYVQKHGPLTFDDFSVVARLMAEGMAAAHSKGILHRDLKPANVLVRKSPGGWQVKLIDFGLAMQQKVAQTGQTTNSVQRSKALLGGSIAGTMDYGAPEQLGRRADPVGNYSDVFGWAKTCCYALFQTTQPMMKHWSALPPQTVQLLEGCLEEDPKKRIGSFAKVLKRLEGQPATPSAPQHEAFADFATEHGDDVSERSAGGSSSRLLGLIAGVGIAIVVVVFGIVQLAGKKSNQSSRLVGTWTNGTKTLEFTTGGTVLKGATTTATFQFDGRRLTIVAKTYSPKYLLDMNSDDEMLLTDESDCYGEFNDLKGKWNRTYKPGSPASPNVSKGGNNSASVRDESARLIGVWTRDDETLTFTSGKTVVKEQRRSADVANYKFDGRKLTISSKDSEENIFDVDLTIEDQMLIGKTESYATNFYELQGRWKKAPGPLSKKNPGDTRQVASGAKANPRKVDEVSQSAKNDKPKGTQPDIGRPELPGPGMMPGPGGPRPGGPGMTPGGPGGPGMMPGGPGGLGMMPGPQIPLPGGIEPGGRKLSPELLNLRPGSFQGRSGTMRAELLQEGGGDQRTEAAVELGLEWLAAQQKPDGSWAIEGQTWNNGATALGVLPFLGAGHTHKAGMHSRVVSKALDYLKKNQTTEGYYGYQHAVATIVICEAYVMTGDPALRLPAQKGIDIIVAGQSSDGGWRYKPKEPGDTSANGWHLIALKTGEMAGLKVPKDTIRLVGTFLDGVMTPEGGYGYMDQRLVLGCTAVGLLSREYLGWKPDEVGLIDGMKLLMQKAPPDGSKSMYYYYHATQALRHFGGEDWSIWNVKMRDMLLQKQITDEDKAGRGNVGSWSPDGDEFGKAGGRLMMTSLSVMTLEVYYRHVPLSLSVRAAPK